MAWVRFWDRVAGGLGIPDTTNMDCILLPRLVPMELTAAAAAAAAAAHLPILLQKCLIRLPTRSPLGGSAAKLGLGFSLEGRVPVKYQFSAARENQPPVFDVVRPSSRIW